MKLAEKKKEDIKFEEAMNELEKIVESMQDGKLTLDESLKKFQEGVGLIRICQKRLDDAEGKINMLLKDSNGNIEEVPFKTGSDN